MEFVELFSFNENKMYSAFSSLYQRDIFINVIIQMISREGVIESIVDLI